MRNWINLCEAFVSGFKGIRGADVEVFKNPTRKEFNYCMEYDQVRAFVVDDDLYVWPIFSAVHQMVREHLNLPLDTAVPIIINGSYGKEVYISVTDNSAKAPYHGTSTAAELIRECGFLNRNFVIDEIGYYDEGYNGPW